MATIKLQRAATRRLRLLGLAGAATLLTVATAGGVLWRTAGSTSHPASRVVNTSAPSPAAPARAATTPLRSAPPAVASWASPQLWLVSTAEQAAELQQRLAEDNLLRAPFGIAPLTAEVASVETAEQSEVVLRDVANANLLRAAAGLPPVELLDLR